MTRSYKAIINPELLVWARKSARMDIDEAAGRLKIPAEKLNSWESGAEALTIVQLRKIAKLYRQPFSAFYLSSPPELFRLPTRDYRRLPDKEAGEVSSHLALEMRLSTERRDICLELLAEEGQSPPEFSLTASREEDPEEIGSRLRSVLGINWADQARWRDPYKAFSIWRDALENNGILVFQATEVPLIEMRGFSLAEFPLPVVVVNRKDVYAGRLFSLIHEVVHVISHSSGVCDLEVHFQLSEEDQRTEVFCNHVAGSALVPREHLLNERFVVQAREPYWNDEVLQELSRCYSVSREVILRRLLILGLTTSDFYQQKREQYLREYRRRPRGEGFIHPVADVISATGKIFTRVVLDAFNSGRITVSDASDFLGLRTKHFDRLGLTLSHS